MKKRAVIFGASGLVGRELLTLLSGDAALSEITVVVRKQMDGQSTKVKQICLTDFSDLDDYRDSLKADEFFCCIGTTIKKAGSEEEFRRVDFQIPVTVARMAEKLSVPSLVVISSLGADERSANFYLRTKGQMERAVAEVYHGNLKFVRPSLLMGKRKEFRFGEKTAMVFMKMLGWIFVGPLKRYKGINAADVALCIKKIASDNSGKKIYESDELHRLAKETRIPKTM